MMMSGFEKNVFINCPFDDDYRQLFLALVFTIKYLGYNPRVALESFDSGEPRINKIVGMISESKFGIHDISRIISCAPDELYRMNMPFELGIDYGCKKFGEGKLKTKKMLILEKEKYRYRAALSDISGSDIKAHDNDESTMVRVVRDWFVTEELKIWTHYLTIWGDYNVFKSCLYELTSQGYNASTIKQAPISEVIHIMDLYFRDTSPPPT